jgi:hypothetical protein
MSPAVDYVLREEKYMEDKEPTPEEDYVMQVQMQVMEILNRVKEELGVDNPVNIEVVTTTDKEDDE